MNAVSSVLQTIKTSTNLQYLFKCNLEAVKDLTSLQNRLISQACFQRIAEVVTLQLDSKQLQPISADPVHSLTCDIIEKNIKKIKKDYLCSVLESLLEMSRIDTRLMKCIESHFMIRMEGCTDMNIVRRLASMHQNHLETNLRLTVYNVSTVDRQWLEH